MTMEQMVMQLNIASNAYYRTGHEIMSNKEWDDMYRELQALEEKTGVVLSDSPTQNTGVHVKETGKEVKHEFPALSLDKSQKIEDLVKWAENRPIWMSYKLDGLTLVATYDDGKLTRLMTRGDGVFGTDITPLAPYIKGVLMNINFQGHMVVRGEAVISYSDFEEYAKTADKMPENPRNLASGALNVTGSITDAIKRVQERHVQWIPFTLVYVDNPDLTTYDRRMNFLEELGFLVVYARYIALPTEDNIKEEIAIFESIMNNEFIPEDVGYLINTDFFKPDIGMNLPVDGLVLAYDDWAYSQTGSVTGHHATRAGFAFKWRDQSVKTKLIDIEWSVAKNFITPVAIFEPVRIEGTTVTRASLCNISECKRLGIGEGSELDVIKANMIIPKVVGATKGKLVIPNKCPVCGAPTEVKQDGISEMLICTNPDCKGKFLGKMETFCSKHGMDIDGMSEKTLEFLIEKGWLNHFSDLYHLSDYMKEWAVEDGFGEKSVSKLLKAIEDSRDTEVNRYLYSWSIPFIGRTASKDIAQYCGSYDKLIQILETDVEEFRNIDGIGDSAIYSLREFAAKHLDDFKELAQKMTFKEIAKVSTNSNIAGITFVITGSLNHFANRDALKEKIEAAGGKVAGSVSAKTGYLINNDITSTSGKNKKAKDLNIPIITEDELLEKFF